MYYVYEHIRPDTNKVFYVGKGSGNRLNIKHGRNIYWKRVVNKSGGFIAKKLFETEDEDFAFFVEEEIIDLYRKRGMNLVNLTDGGEGASSGNKNPRYNYNSIRQKKIRGEISHVPKEIMRANMRKNHWSKTGKWSPKGIKRSEEIKQKMRGKRKSIAGGKNPKAKIIVYNNKEFLCIKDFANFLNVNYKTLVVKLRRIKRTVFTLDDFNSLTNGSTYFNEVKNEKKPK